MTITETAITGSPEKSFEIAYRAKETKGNAVSFRLEWKDATGQTQFERFTAYPDLIPEVTTLRIGNMEAEGNSSAFFDTFAKAMGGKREKKTDDDGNEVPPTEYERFFDFCQAPEHDVEIKTLVAVLNYLTEVDTGRPTVPSTS